MAQVISDPTLVQRMGVPTSNTGRWLLIAGAAAILWGMGLAPSGVGSLLIILGIVSALAGWAMPTPMKRAEAERARRVAEATALLDGESFSRERIEGFWKRQSELGLVDSDLPDAVTRANAISDVLDFAHARAENGNSFQVVPGHERAVGQDDCYFVATVLYDKRGDNDEDGQLFLTKQRAVFVGASMADVKWGKVAKAELNGGRLTITRRDRATPLVFVMKSVSDALRADFVATACLESSTVE